MTPQEVIKTFMAKLANHGYTSASSVGTNMLNDAVKASSDFLSIQNVIDSMKADQTAAEREAVEEVLGSDYARKTLSDLSSSIRGASAKTYDTENRGNAYLNSSNDQRTTVERLIKERKAYIFLEKYCGIQLEENYWITSSNGTTSWTGDTTGNVDTGAITGSDANISLTAGDVFYGTTLTSDLMTTLARQDGISLSGDTLIIGTGVEKDRNSVVPEIGNMYTASTAQAQSISTGANDWIVVTGDTADTILTGGADSIVAGSGNDKITVGADYASILTSEGSDTVEISAEVNNVTLGDLDSNDILTISGTFQVGTAQIEDNLLIVTDKTGTRQIRLGDLDNAKNARVNSTTLATWLSNAGININSISSSSSANLIENSASGKTNGGGRIAIDDEYQPAQTRSNSSAEETQDIATRNSNGTYSVNLNDVTITEGNITAGSTTVGAISNQFPNVSTFTKNGLTINLLGVTSDKNGSNSAIQSRTLDQLTTDQKTIVAGLFKWWAKECLNLNEDSYGISFKSPDAMVNEIGLFFYDSGSSANTLATVWNSSISGKTIDLKLNVNMKYYKGIEADNVDGESSSTSAFLDRTLAHEFTHAVMGANIDYFTSLPQFIKEGSAELTHGIDDERGTRIFDLAYDASRLNSALNLSNTGTGTSDAYAGGYMFLRYFARQASLQSIADYENPDAGGSWTISGTTATYIVDGTVVATIKGLASGLAAKGTTIDGITVSGNVITLSKKVLGTTNVTLTSNNYTLALGDDLADNVVTFNDMAWTVSNGTATLKGNLTAGYTLLETGKTITYTAAKNNQTLATVTGLAKSGIYASDFSTTDSVITLKKSMLGTANVKVVGDGYTLALANDAPEPELQPEYWTVGGTAATYRQDTSAGFTLAADAKSATYSKQTTVTLATVNGIQKVNANNKAAIEADITISDKVITLGKDALGTSRVTVAGDGYTLALDEDAPKPTLQPEYWTVSGTAATYRQDTSAGFTLAADAKSATYSKQTTVTLATVNGIQKVTAANKTAIEADITISDKVITLGADALGTSRVTVAGDGYTLALDEDAPKPTLQPEYWTVGGTAAAYRQDTSAGFTLAADAKSATYSKQTTVTLATVNGIQKVNANNKAAIEADITIRDKVITLGKDALTTTNVKVTGAGYTLAMDSTLTDDTPEERWTVNRTNATYDRFRPAHFKASANNQTFTYNRETKLANLVTVKGLINGATVNGDGNVADKDGNTILTLADNALTLTGDDAFGNRVEVTLSNDYTLNNQLTAPAITNTYWAVTNGNATLKQEKTDGYTLTTKNGAQILTYDTAKTGRTTLTLATVSGLNKTLTDTEGTLSGLDYDLDDKTITVANSVLTKSNLTLKGDFKLELVTTGDDAVPTATENATLWEVNGTNAVYKDVKIGYFTRKNDKAFNYNKETVLATHATISGLRNNAALDSFTLSDNVITLTADALVENPNYNTKIALNTKEDYTLALGDGVANVEYNDAAWSYSGGNAFLRSSVKTAGYLPSDDAKTLTYITTADTRGNAVTKTLTTVSGVKSASGLTVEDSVIKLTAAALNNRNVTLGKNDPYTLALGDSSLAPTTIAETWSKSGSRANLTATYSAGYTPSADERTLIYSAKNTVKTLAQINGINPNVDLETFRTVEDGDSKKIPLTAYQLTNNVAISGECEFEFDDAVGYAAITGSNADDTISVTGIGLSVTGGRGNDSITLGGNKNTFIYASGDGDDVIADFTADDKIKITNGTPTVGSEGSDAIITVGAGSIKLSGAAGQTITILDAKNTAKTYATTAPTAGLFFDENYSATPYLSEIIKPDTASYTPYEFGDFSLTKEDKLTPILNYSKEK